MFHDRQTLSDLIGSRICHDLISPLGAISNGLELLTMTGIENSPELDLIAQSVENANSKIRFFRIAYGRAPHGTTLARAEICSVLGDYFKGGRHQIDWKPSHELQRREVRLAFLAIQCLESAMPFGGLIEIAINGQAWELSAKSDKFRDQSPLWAVLSGENREDEVAASDVQFAVFASLAQFRKTKPMVEQGADAITLRF